MAYASASITDKYPAPPGAGMKRWRAFLKEKEDAKEADEARSKANWQNVRTEAQAFKTVADVLTTKNYDYIQQWMVRYMDQAIHVLGSNPEISDKILRAFFNTKTAKRPPPLTCDDVIHQVNTGEMSVQKGAEIVKMIRSNSEMQVFDELTKKIPDLMEKLQLLQSNNTNKIVID